MTISHNGDDVAERLELLARQYGNRFLREAAPDHQLPEHGMTGTDAMRLIEEELVLDGIPMRNLATFVTTWMEPEAQRLITENLYRNFIDHAEYPQTAEIEQRCIRMLAHLFHAPGETTAARCRGLGGHHARRAVAEVNGAAPRSRRQGHEPPEPRVSAATCTSCRESSAATSTSSRASSRCRPTSTRSTKTSTPRRRNTIGVAAVVRPRSPATPTTSRHQRPARPAPRREGTRRPAARQRRRRGMSHGRLPIGRLRLEQVRSINVSATSSGRLPGHRMADLPRARRPRQGPRLLRDLPRRPTRRSR